MLKNVFVLVGLWVVIVKIQVLIEWVCDEVVVD